MPVTNAASGIKAGTVAHFAASTAPAGWLKANGALVSRATYAALFAAIGTTYGAGDGVTTFAVPDLRGEFVRGLDDGRGVDAARAIGTSQVESIKSHNHQQANNWQGFGAFGSSSSAVDTARSDQGGVFNGTDKPLTGTTGGTETRPRNVALLACIKF